MIIIIIVNYYQVTATALALWADSTLYRRTPGWSITEASPVLSQAKINALHKELWPVVQKVATMMPHIRTSSSSNGLLASVASKNEGERARRKVTTNGLNNGANDAGAILAELAMVNSQGITYRKSL